MLCRRLTPPYLCRRALPNSKSREYLLYSCSFSPYIGNHWPDAAGMWWTTLARLPFRLGLGRVWTPLVIFRTLSPFVLLSVLGYYFAFRCYLDLCIVSIWILARWSRCCVCSFGIYCKLLRCNHLWSNPPALRACLICTWYLVGVYESFLCGVWRESLKLHRLDLGVVTRLLTTRQTMVACAVQRAR